MQQAMGSEVYDGLGRDTRMEGPFVLELRYYGKRPDNKIGIAVIQFSPGQTPSPEELAHAIASTKEDLAGGEGFSEMTKPEFWRLLCSIQNEGKLLPMPGALTWESRK
jgi:hypothetical protein